MINNNIAEQNWLIKFLKILSPKFFIPFFISGIFGAGLYYTSYLMPIYQKQLVNDAFKYKTIISDSFYYFLLIYGCFIISSLLYTTINSYLGAFVRKKVMRYFFINVKNIDSNELNKNGIGFYYNLLTEDFQIVYVLFSEQGFFDVIFSGIQATFIFITIYSWNVIIFKYIIYSFITVLAIIVFYPIISAIFQKKEREWSLKTNSFFNDMIINRTGIFIFNSVETFLKKYKKLYKKQISYSFKKELAGEYIFALVMLSKDFWGILIILKSISLIIKDEMSFGTLIGIIAFYAMILNPLKTFAQVLMRLKFAKISAGKLFTQIRSDSTTVENINYIKNIDSLKIENLTNSFLTDLNIDIGNSEINNIIGIVGMSGEGKSVLKNHLTKTFFTNKIHINNNTIISNICDLNYYYLINVLDQENVIFDNNLIYNLTLGKKIITEKEKQEYINKIEIQIDKFCKILFSNTNIDKFITSIENLNFENDYLYFDQLYELIVSHSTQKRSVSYYQNIFKNDTNLIPLIINILFSINYVFKEKLDHILGILNLSDLKDKKLGEKGNKISGGEKQRVALGRFLLKESYSFFIIDEPFTSLDLLSEKKLTDILMQEIKDKKGIIISHNFRILKKISQYFYVLDDKTILEQGNHNDLMQKENLYYKLYNNFKKV